jgi:hypothetical protein
MGAEANRFFMMGNGNRSRAGVKKLVFAQERKSATS